MNYIPNEGYSSQWCGKHIRFNQIIKMKKKYFISENFPIDIDKIHSQNSSKFLLTGILNISKKNKDNSFTREELNDWLISNMNNPEFSEYNSNINKKNNLKNYWNYAHLWRNDPPNIPHNARILNFESFYN